MVLVRVLHNAPNQDSKEKSIKLRRYTSYISFSYLCDPQASPFILPEQLQGTFGRVEVISRDGFEHVFGKLDMAVFVLVVGVPFGVKSVFIQGRV